MITDRVTLEIAGAPNPNVIGRGRFARYITQDRANWQRRIREAADREGALGRCAIEAFTIDWGRRMVRLSVRERVRLVTLAYDALDAPAGARPWPAMSEGSTSGQGTVWITVRINE